MKTPVQRITQLGELVVAVFDAAARYSKSPLEVSRLATQTVAHMLRMRRTNAPLAAKKSASRPAVVADASRN